MDICSEAEFFVHQVSLGILFGPFPGEAVLVIDHPVSVKGLFLMSCLNFPWCRFMPFPHVLPLVTRKRREEISTSPSSASFEEGADCVEVTPQPSSSWANQAAPSKSCPWDLSSFWSPPLHTLCQFDVLTVRHPNQHTVLEVGLHQCRAGQSLPLLGLLHSAGCTPGYSWPFHLPGHTVDSSTACHQPRTLYPALLLLLVLPFMHLTRITPSWVENPAKQSQESFSMLACLILVISFFFIQKFLSGSMLLQDRL